MSDIAIHFGTDDDGWTDLDDVAFLQAVAFGSAASPKRKAAAAKGDVSAFVDELRSDWPKPETGEKKARRRSFRAAWSVDAAEPSERSRDLLRIGERLATATGRPAKRPSGRRDEIVVEAGRVRPAKGDFGELAAWCESVAFGEPVTPWEAVALSEILVEYGGLLSRAEFWAVWRTLLSAAIGHARTLDAEDIGVPADEALLRGGELPWASGTLFADVKGASKLRRRGVRRLGGDVLDRSDTDGTPAADTCERLPFWLASLVRATALGRRLGDDPLDPESFERLHDLLGVVAAWSRADGTLALSTATFDVRPMLAEGLRVTGWKSKSAPRRLVESASGKGKNGKASRRHETNGRARSGDPEPSVQSDWARVAGLRSDWSAEADSLVVRHDGRLPVLDLAVFGRTLLAGEWSLSVSLDGEPVAFEEQGWECVCWFSDEEVDYVELQYPVDDESRIERQLLLPRGERCAVLADAVTAKPGVRIDYESRLPIVPGLEARADTETRECILTAKRQVARILPLGLPQDRTRSAAGWFGPDDGSLRLEQAALGGLYAPLVFDWALDRANRLADWRTLTITEAGEILTTGVAHGHRVRIGKHQLLLYRSLVKGGTARAVLGHHTAHETVVGRFDRSGEVEPLVLVE